MNRSLTFVAFLAEVSKKRRRASRAYVSASAVGTARLDGSAVTRSSLLPARAMTIESGAWRWSSLTQDLALSREAWHACVNRRIHACGKECLAEKSANGVCDWVRLIRTYSLGYIVYNNGAIRVSVVHGRE